MNTPRKQSAVKINFALQIAGRTDPRGERHGKLRKRMLTEQTAVRLHGVVRTTQILRRYRLCTKIMSILKSCNPVKLTSVVQMHDCLDVMSLRKQIKRSQRTDAITTGDQFLQIARERRRIARDVTDPCRLEIENSFDHCRFSASSRRIEQDEINPGASAAEPFGTNPSPSPQSHARLSILHAANFAAQNERRRDSIQRR